MRLVQSGQHAAAIKLDRQFASIARGGDKAQKAAHDRRQMMDEPMAAMPAADRQLLELELENFAQGRSMDLSGSVGPGAKSKGKAADMSTSMSWEHMTPPVTANSAARLLRPRLQKRCYLRYPAPPLARKCQNRLHTDRSSSVASLRNRPALVLRTDGKPSQPPSLPPLGIANNLCSSPAAARTQPQMPFTNPPHPRARSVPTYSAPLADASGICVRKPFDPSCPKSLCLRFCELLEVREAGRGRHVHHGPARPRREHALGHVRQ